MSKVALIDGDGFLYRMAASVEKMVHGVSWTSPQSLLAFGRFENYRAARATAEERSGELWQRKEIGTIDQATARLRAAVNETMGQTGCSTLLFVVSGTRNFRDQIGTIRKYKGNRDSTARPILLGELREWAEREYKGYLTTDNMEADDLISIIAREEDDDKNVIVSNDKDLRQVPGYHYNWVTGEREYISTVTAKQNLYKQVLLGDPGDNIVGCWGVGPAKAAAIAQEWIEEGWSDALIWGDMVGHFDASREVSGCPYKDLDGDEVAEEMYQLVHLLEYYEEASDILKELYKCQTNKNKNQIEERIEKRNGNHQESATSKCAPSAQGTEQKESGQSAPSATD